MLSGLIGEFACGSRKHSWHLVLQHGVGHLLLQLSAPSDPNLLDDQKCCSFTIQLLLQHSHYVFSFPFSLLLAVFRNFILWLCSPRASLFLFVFSPLSGLILSFSFLSIFAVFLSSLSYSILSVLHSFISSFAVFLMQEISPKKKFANRSYNSPCKKQNSQLNANAI